MRLAEACAKLRARGCTNAWFLYIMKPATVRSLYEIDGPWIENQDRAQQKERPGSWLVEDRYVYFVPNDTPTTKVRVFYGA